MMNRAKYAGAGLALVLSMACSGSRSDTPVVTRTGDTSTTSPAGASVAARGRSMVRLVNAVPADQRIDVSGNDRTVFSSIEYKAVTAYQEIGDNQVTFRLRRAGRDSVLNQNRETLTDGSRYTIVTLPGEHGELGMRILKDEVGPDSGTARLRIINAAPDIGKIDVAILGQKEPLFSGVAYAGEADYKDVAPGTITLDVRSDLKNRRPVQLKRRLFEAGRAYTIVLAGKGTSDIETIAFDDTEVSARLTLGGTP